MLVFERNDDAHVSKPGLPAGEAGRKMKPDRTTGFRQRMTSSESPIPLF
jgi:hypothetical protein